MNSARLLAYGLLLVGLAVPSGLLAQRSDLVPAPRRAVTLEQGRALLAARDAANLELPASIPSPFLAPEAEPVPGPAAQTPVAGPAPTVRVFSDAEILAAVAPRITPTGTVVLGGEPILLFGQKRLKVGDVYPISFEGREYEVVITAIDRTSYTLRLNQELLTRPL